MPEVEKAFVQVAIDLKQIPDGIDQIPDPPVFRIRARDLYGPLLDALIKDSGDRYPLLDRIQKEEPLHAPPDYYQVPKISPDGTKVALNISADGIQVVWIWDLVRETMTRLTFDKSRNIQPIWTRDGKRIVLLSVGEGSQGLCWKAADGTGKVETLGSAPDRIMLPWSWSSDGKNLITVESDNAFTIFDIGTLSMEGVIR